MGKEILQEFTCLQSHIDFVLSSPLKRALRTATHAILPLVEKEMNSKTYECPVYVLEYARERINHHACDSRNDFAEIKQEWKDFDFIYKDFDTNKDMQWNSNEDEKRESLWRRSAKFMEFVWNNEGDVVVYSGHCDFIMSLMELIVGMPFYKPRNAAYFPIIISTI